MRFYTNNNMKTFIPSIFLLLLSFSLVSNLHKNDVIVNGFLIQNKRLPLLNNNNNNHFIRLDSIQKGTDENGNIHSTSSGTILQNHDGKTEKQIVVIGAGIGGLATASRIASSLSSRKTHNSKVTVTILEKNPKSYKGGRCGSFSRHIPPYGTFRHEKGPSLLLLKDVYLESFRDCKQEKDVQNDYGLCIKQCIPAYQVVFEDGDRIQLGFPKHYTKNTETDIDQNHINQLQEISRKKMDTWEHNGALKWDEYMRITSAYLDCGLPNFIQERLDLVSFPSFISECLRDFFKAWPLKPHSDVLDAIFQSNKMKALASFQDLYVGLEPYRNNAQFGGGVIKKTAPAVFGLLSALELHPDNSKAGVYAPINGFQAVSDAYEKLALDCGVVIQYNKTVTQITDDGVWFLDDDNSHHKEDNVNNPTLNFLPADIVIVNADLPFATKSLFTQSDHSSRTIEEKSLPGSLMSSSDIKSTREVRYDWDDELDFSSGVIAFHWSVNKRCHDLNTHNVFLNAMNAVNSWSVIRQNQKPRAEDFTKGIPSFNFYVHRASATDDKAAPPDCDSIMILVPCPSISREEEYSKLSKNECIKKYSLQYDDEYIAAVRSAVLSRLSVLEDLKDLSDCIIDEVIDTPPSYADMYNVGAGTPFGLSHGFGQLSITRPAQESKFHDNVYFVGASTRPGNGVPLVLIGSKIVAEKVLKKLSYEHRGACYYTFCNVNVTHYYFLFPSIILIYNYIFIWTQNNVILAFMRTDKTTIYVEDDDDTIITSHLSFLNHKVIDDFYHSKSKNSSCPSCSKPIHHIEGERLNDTNHANVLGIVDNYALDREVSTDITHSSEEKSSELDDTMCITNYTNSDDKNQCINKEDKKSRSYHKLKRIISKVNCVDSPRTSKVPSSSFRQSEKRETVANSIQMLCNIKQCYKIPKHHERSKSLLEMDQFASFADWDNIEVFLNDRMMYDDTVDFDMMEPTGSIHTFY